MLNNKLNLIMQYIYELTDPRTGEPRYIGKTNNLERRLKGHLKEATLLNVKITKKVSWIKNLLKENLQPTLNIIDKVEEDEWEFWEQHYISLYKSWGFNLTNGTEGGDGNSCWQKKHKEETKRKISLAHKGRKFSDEHKTKLSVVRGNTVIGLNLKTQETTEYNNLKQTSIQTQISSCILGKHIKNKNPINDVLFQFKTKKKQVHYPKERKHSIKVKEPIYQIDSNSVVVKLWENGKKVWEAYLPNPIATIGQFHLICRTKGKKTYKGYFWIYQKDLNKIYQPGDIITELNLKTKNTEIIVFKQGIPINKFSSIVEASKYFKVSETTIKNYFKNGKELKGYILKPKNLPKRKLEYKEVVYTKEDLLKKTNIELEQIVEEFYNIVKGTSFPYPESKENLFEITKKIRNFDLDSLVKNNVFKNMTSSIGTSYLKSCFPNYYHCNYKKGLTPIEVWNNEKTLKEVIRYRVGLNKNRETFNLSLHQIIRGISARRSSISFFKPIVAAAIYKYFLKDNPSPIVIDPCAGFGGRLLGFKSLYPQGTYIGIEPNKETFNNLNKLASNFKEVELYNCKLEDYKGNKECDLTFTSIPYFDLENYNNDFFYENLQEWKNTFIKNLLTYKNLLINLPEKLQEELQLQYKSKYFLKNGTSHFNKTLKDKFELILYL